MFHHVPRDHFGLLVGREDMPVNPLLHQPFNLAVWCIRQQKLEPLALPSVIRSRSLVVVQDACRLASSAMEDKNSPALQIGVKQLRPLTWTVVDSNF